MSDYFDDLLSKYRLSRSVLDEIKNSPEPVRETAGNLLDASANAIANDFLSGNLEFGDADALLTTAMDAAAWKAPMFFWKVFLAFEDSETDEVPEQTAVARVKSALAGDGS